MKVYLDNAATTPLAPEVVEEMMPYLTTHFGNPSSIHGYGRAAKAAIEKARKLVAKHLNASTSEIIFTGSGTEANNTVIKCAVRDLGVTRIISSRAEHHCVLHSLDAVEKTGVTVHYVTLNGQGHVDFTELEQLLSQGPKTLVTLMHANNEIGTLTDIARVAALCQQYGAYFHSDTVQTVGYFPLDVQQVPVHFLSGSAHKFHGPKGIGFLFLRAGVHIHPFVDGGAQERNMRAGTENVPGIVGLGKALDLAVTEMEANRTYISGLKHYMIQQLTQHIPDVAFNGDVSDTGSNYKVLSVSLPPHPKTELALFNLDMAGIAASGGSACTSGSEKASHVLEAIQAPHNRKAIRFSFSKYNTPNDIDAAIQVLVKMLQAG